jgi:hypothetical protein
MKLLEVDEAANHIRELVDPDANIIWGSAFNPISTARSASRWSRPASSMSGLSRGLGRGQSADDEDDDGPTVTKFPQFLNRQGNQ